MGSFTGITTATSALVSVTRMLDVTNHNVANSTTPGFSRQRADLQQQVSMGKGIGVSMVGLDRLRNPYMDNEYRSLSARAASYAAREDGLDRVERAVGVAGEGSIGDAMQALYDAFAQLADNPDSIPHRSGVRSAAELTASLIRQAATSIDNAKTATDQELSDEVATVDGLAAKIKELNIRIGVGTRGGVFTADLEDMRDQAIDQLAQLAPTSVTRDANNRYTVTFGNQTLVDATTGVVGPFTVDASGVFRIGSTVTTVSTGKLEGLVTTRDQIIGGATGQRARLDEFAQALMTRVNTAHAAGYGLDAVTGRNLFSGTDASDIAVDAAVQGSLEVIAAAGSTSELPNGATGARNLLATRDTAAVLFGTSQGLQTGWQTFVAELGAKSREVRDMGRIMDSSQRAVANRRDEASAVNVDEEMTYMLRYKKTYDASATMINIMDGLMGRLIDVVR